MDWLQLKAKKLLDERSDFPEKETIKTKDRFSINQGQKVVESTVAFSRNRKNGNY